MIPPYACGLYSGPEPWADASGNPTFASRFSRGGTLPSLTDIQRPWLESYDTEVPHNLDYSHGPLFEHLERSAVNSPDRIAIVFKNWRITYTQLKRFTDTMAANLISHGLEPGERVAIMLPNIPQTVISFWAVLKAGGVGVMTNPLYMENELVHQLGDSGARFLITLDHLWPKVDGLRDKLKIEKYFTTSIPDCLGFPLNRLYPFKARKMGLNLAVPHDNKNVFRLKPLWTRRGNAWSEPSGSGDDLALLQYTGGTTGQAKGAMLSHANLSANVTQCQAMLHAVGKNPEGERFIGLLPYFHVYGLTVCMTFPTSLGATLMPLPRFTPLEVLQTIHKLKPTIFPGAPSVYMALLQQKAAADYDLSSIEVCVSGSAPMPVDGHRRFNETTGAVIVEGYGLTEASPVTHFNPLNREQKVGSIGLPFPDTDARVVDMETGERDMGFNEPGELLIRGPQVMQGYWNRPEDTAKSLRDGWLHTGDIAVMDERGYFSIVDRKKDMILTGGYNVYPREIDEVLIAHPKIKEAVSVGIPHPSRGEIIKAYVVVKEGETLGRHELLKFCKQKLAGYKTPRQVEFRDDLPKTAVGKVLRRELVDEELKRKKASTA
ncbi:MAG: long-chain fatty acid--CoA ligase [Desulfovibrio sp.]|nr:MAG: long-chain fatty acid--CoA ligase [Desulfovibrio sp.]